MTATLLDWAQRYASHGLHVIPVHTMINGDCSCPPKSPLRRDHPDAPRCKSPGKHPAIRTWQTEASTDVGQLRAWFEGTRRNVGIVCGPSNITTIDIDPRNGGNETFAALLRELGPLPSTVTAISGSGGAHYVFRRPAGDLVADLGDGVDLLRDAKQFVVEPSIHPSGNRYHWRDGHAPGDIAIAELPEPWIARMLRKTTIPRADALAYGDDEGRGFEHQTKADTRGLCVDPIERARAYLATMSPSIQGKNGSGDLFAAVCRMMHGFSLDDATVRQLIAADFNPRCQPPWSDREIDHKIADARDKADADRWRIEDRPPPIQASGSSGSPSGDPPLERIIVRDASALGLAKAVVDELGVDEQGRRNLARYLGQWWRWRDGHHRALDDESTRAGFWRTLARVVVETVDEDGKVESGRLKVTSSRVSEVLDAMRSVTDMIEPAAELPCALPGYDGPDVRQVVVVRNGLLNLATSELHPSTPRLFATAGAAVDYDPSALCPSWEKFLVEIFTGEDGTDEETIRLVQQIFGWMVAGDTTRHKIPLFVGLPRSGKSTLMTILRALLGEGNVCAPSLALLGDSRFGLAPLVGKSAAIIPDARLSSKADQQAIAGLLLAISGRDPVEIDRKNRDSISARLRCRIVIVSNELPRIGDASGALAGRFLVVETRQSFASREDLTLEGRLLAELPGILQWSLLGWRDLVENGWVRPAHAQEIIDELDRLGSPIKAFVSDRLVQVPGAETTVEKLYSEWCEWCGANGRKEPGTVQTFSRDLRAAIPSAKVVQRRTETGRIRVYTGIGLRALASGGDDSSDDTSSDTTFPW